MRDNYNYSIYFDFIDTYLTQGFLDIKANDPIVKKLDRLMELNDQMIIVMDLTQTKIVYTSKRSKVMLGINPTENNPLEMMSRAHPDDLHRFGLGRAKLMSLDGELFEKHKGASIFSTNIRMRKPDETYACHLFQFYLFYSTIPYESVFSIQVNTNIDWYKYKQESFHYYVGDDTSQFRFPDEELLSIGLILTPREFEILELISKGFSNDELAEKLFLSLHTINTHRRNILHKFDKHHLSDVIYELKDQGIL